MRIGSLLFSAIVVLFITCLLVSGLTLLILPFAERFRHGLIYVIAERTTLLGCVGGGLFLLALLLTTAIFSMQRRRYYRLKVGRYAVSVSDEVFEKQVVKYWQGLFPDAVIPMQVWVTPRGIHIDAELPAMPFDEQKPLLERASQELSDLFADLLHKRHELYLSASFPERLQPFPNGALD